MRGLKTFGKTDGGNPNSVWEKMRTETLTQGVLSFGIAGQDAGKIQAGGGNVDFSVSNLAQVYDGIKAYSFHSSNVSSNEGKARITYVNTGVLSRNEQASKTAMEIFEGEKNLVFGLEAGHLGNAGWDGKTITLNSDALSFEGGLLTNDALATYTAFMAKEGYILDYNNARGNTREKEHYMLGLGGEAEDVVMRDRYNRESKSFIITDEVLNNLSQNLGIDMSDQSLRDKISTAASGDLSDWDWQSGQDGALAGAMKLFHQAPGAGIFAPIVAGAAIGYGLGAVVWDNREDIQAAADWVIDGSLGLLGFVGDLVSDTVRKLTPSLDDLKPGGGSPEPEKDPDTKGVIADALINGLKVVQILSEKINSSGSSDKKLSESHPTHIYSDEDGNTYEAQYVTHFGREILAGWKKVAGKDGVGAVSGAPNNEKETGTERQGYNGPSDGWHNQKWNFDNESFNGSTPINGNKYWGKDKQMSVQGQANDGYLYDRSGNLLTGSYIYNIDKHGTIYFEQPMHRQRHHSSLIGGENSFGAGEMKVQNGIIKYIDDATGHYSGNNGYRLDAYQNYLKNILQSQKIRNVNKIQYKSYMKR